MSPLFSFLGRESPALQAYGKLPLAKDYLRIGCGDGSGRELREWLDRGFGGARDAAGQVVLGEPLRFIGQGAGEPLQGCVWPSSDAGELRLFPFAIFVARRKKALAGDIADGLGRAESVWRSLEETYSECLRAGDGQQMLGALRGRDVDVSAMQALEGATVALEAWLACLWPESGADGLFEALASIAALARARHGEPYRLPLARDLALREQVLGWLCALVSLGALPEGEVPTLFFPVGSLVPGASERGPGALVVSPRPLSEAQARWLLPLDAGEDLGAADLCRGIAPVAAESETPHAGGAPLRESLRGALAEFRGRS